MQENESQIIKSFFMFEAISVKQILVYGKPDVLNSGVLVPVWLLYINMTYLKPILCMPTKPILPKLYAH